MQRRRRLTLSFQLSENPKVAYSDGEKRLFQILSKGKVNSTVLADRFYEGSDKPFHAVKAVTAMIRSLEKKMTANKEKVALVSGPQGPFPMDWSLQKKNGK